MSFHQLIIFTNLQPRKKVHSGLNNLGQEPCGKAEGTEARQRRSRPKATSCLSSRSCLGFRPDHVPCGPQEKGCPANKTHTGRPPWPPCPQPAPTPSFLDVSALCSQLPPGSLCSPAECRPLHVLFLLPRMPFLSLHQGCRSNDTYHPRGALDTWMSRAVPGGLREVAFDLRLPKCPSKKGWGVEAGRKAGQLLMRWA